MAREETEIGRWSQGCTVFCLALVEGSANLAGTPMKLIILKPLTLVCLASFLASAAVRAEPELKGTSAELATYLASVPGNVQIVGEGEIKMAADRALVSLRVDSENKSLAEALKDNQNTRARVVEFLKQQGIAPERVQVTPFSSTQRQAVFSDKVKSHKVSAILKVTTHDEQEFRSATRAVDQFSDVSFVQAEFEHSDKEALRAGATAKACDEVNRQKQIYEEKLGVKLVVKTIQNQTQVPSPIPVRRYAAAYEKSDYASSTASTPLPAAGVVAGADEQQTPFGELIFSTRLLVEFSVQPK